MRKAHETGSRIIECTILRAGEVLEQPVARRRSGGVEARKELAPEDRQEPIGAKAGGEEQPVVRTAGPRASQAIDRTNPSAREGGRTPRHRVNDRVARINGGQ